MEENDWQGPRPIKMQNTVLLKKSKIALKEMSKRAKGELWYGEGTLYVLARRQMFTFKSKFVN